MKTFELIEAKDADPRCTNYFVKVDGAIMDMAVDGYIEMNHWTSMQPGWYQVMRWNQNGFNLVDSFEGTMDECKEYIDQLLNGVQC